MNELESMLGQLSSNQASAVHETCQRFETSLREGSQVAPPCVEDFLENAKADHRKVLLLKLIALETEHRQAQGEVPTFQEYAQRFPEDSWVLEQLRNPGVPAILAEQPIATGTASPGLPQKESISPVQNETVDSLDKVSPEMQTRDYVPGNEEDLGGELDDVPGENSVSVEDHTTWKPQKPTDLQKHDTHKTTNHAGSSEKPVLEKDRTTSQIVAGYHILRELGRGGMGVVYQAYQPALDRTVALKMILAGAHASEDHLQRFRTEAEAVARLVHPNVVQIHDVGDHEGLPYFSLEFCGGGALVDQLDGTPWPEQQAAQLMEILARAMYVAHQAGIVHRDLKPHNVLLDETGTPKITDFGLAKKLEDTEGVTKTEAVMGTPSYMAPEQARGETKQVGPPADIYALGAVLYQLVTGRPPFKATSGWDTIAQVIRDEPVTPRQLNPKVSKDLETICLKCLEKDAQKRYASAEALADDLRRLQRNEPIHARSITRAERAWRWCRRNPVVAGLLTAVAVSLLGGLIVSRIFYQREQVKARENLQLAANEKVQKENAEKLAQKNGELAKKEARAREEEEQQRFKAEGLAKENLEIAEAERRARKQVEKALERASFVIYGYGLREAQFKLKSGLLEDAENELKRCDPQLRGWEHDYLLHQTRRSLWNVVVPGRITNVSFSPDGKRIATRYSRGIKLLDAETAQELRSFFTPYAEGRSTCFSPDSKRLAIGTHTGVLVVDAETGQNVLKCNAGNIKAPELSPAPVAYSPDGKRIISGHTAWQVDQKKGKWVPGNGVVKVWDAASGKELLSLQGHTSVISSVAFSPDGRHLASGSFDRTVKVWDVKTGKESSSLNGHTDSVVALAYSPDSKRLATASHDKTVRVWDAATGQVIFIYRGSIRKAENLADLKGWIHDLTYSPDGKYLAGAAWDQKVRVWETTQGQEVLVLPHGRGGSAGLMVSSVAFSPDSKRLASTDLGTNVGGSGRLKLWDVSMGRHLRTLEGHTEQVSHVVYSSDGKHVASTEFRFRQPDQQVIKVWNVQTGQALVTIKPGWFVRSLALSPDGSRVLGGGTTAGGSDKRPEIRVWDAFTGKEILSLESPQKHVTGVAFSSDGKRIFSGSVLIDPGKGAFGEVSAWDASNGKKLLSRRTAPFNQMCLSRDGSYLATNSVPVKVFDTGKLEEVSSFARPSGEISCICFSPDGEHLAGAYQHARRGVVKVWERTTGKEVLSIQGPTTLVMGVSYSPNGKRLATAFYDGTVRIWDTKTGQEALALRDHTDAVYSVAFSPDGTTLVSGAKDRALKVWVTEDKPRPTYTFRPDAPHIPMVNHYPEGKPLAAPGPDSTMKVSDLATGKVLCTLQWEKTGSVSSIAFSLDGRRIITGGMGSDPNTQIPIPGGFGRPRTRAKTWGEAKLWDASTGKELRSLEAHSVGVRAVTFSPDRERFATSTGGSPGPLVSSKMWGEVKVWDATTGKVVWTVRDFSGPVNRVLFSPDGKHLACASSGPYDQRRRIRPGEVRIVDAATGVTVTTLVGHTSPVTVLAISPDGRQLASAAAAVDRDSVSRGELIVWSTGTWKPTFTVTGYPDRNVDALTFRADGKRLAQACTGLNGTISLRVWDAGTGERIHRFQLPAGALRALVFSPDGKRLMATTLDKEVNVWEHSVADVADK